MEAFVAVLINADGKLPERNPRPERLINFELPCHHLRRVALPWRVGGGASELPGARPFPDA